MRFKSGMVSHALAILVLVVLRSTQMRTLPVHGKGIVDGNNETGLSPSGIISAFLSL